MLDGASLYLSVGHDEYWSRGMRDTVEAFIARGGNAAFFSGNTSLWQVRIEGDDHDVMVGYKGFFKNDPLMGTDREPEVTTFWSDVVVGRPENHMTGVSFTRGGYHRIGRNVTTGLGGYTVHRAGHWIFDGTGLGYGDVLGAGATVVGYECDGCVFTYRDGLPYPTGEDGTPSTFEILGTCPTQHFTRETAPRPPKPGEPSELEYIASRVFGTREPEAMERIRHGHAVLGAYTNDAGATVVTSGSTDWAHGLAGARPADRADHPERADPAGVASRNRGSPDSLPRRPVVGCRSSPGGPPPGEEVLMYASIVAVDGPLLHRPPTRRQRQTLAVVAVLALLLFAVSRTGTIDLGAAEPDGAGASGQPAPRRCRLPDDLRRRRVRVPRERVGRAARRGPHRHRAGRAGPARSNPERLVGHRERATSGRWPRRRPSGSPSGPTRSSGTLCSPRPPPGGVTSSCAPRSTA